MHQAIDIEALCTQRGLRITEQRRVIAKVLSEATDHPDVEALHERASAYGAFYAADSVLVDDPAVKARRLMLCARTAAIMETGLRLLGIEPLERM